MQINGKFTLRLLSKVIHLFYQSLVRIFPQKGLVYMIHDIGNEESEFVVPQQSFEEFLKKHRNDNFIRLEEWETNKDFIAITIDDVPVGFYQLGYPLLKKFKIPFTIFVNIDLLDKAGYITRGMLKDMCDSGLATVGSHGLTHSFYRNLSDTEKHKFLEKSKNTLEQICSKPITLFAFPYGSLYACGFRKKKLICDYYTYGFGTVSASITSPSLLPKYYLPRINLTTKNIDKV